MTPVRKRHATVIKEYHGVYGAMITRKLMRNKPVRAIISFFPSVLVKRSISHFMCGRFRFGNFDASQKYSFKVLPNNLSTV